MSSRATLYDHGARKSGTDNYHTPKWFVEKLKHTALLTDRYLDPCPGVLPGWTGAAGSVNYPQESGLLVDWWDYNFVNPPFSTIEEWIYKAVSERGKGRTSIWFCKLDFRTKWGQKLVKASNIVLPALGYVKYFDPYQDRGSATFQSCTALFSPHECGADIFESQIHTLFPDKFWFPRLQG